MKYKIYTDFSIDNILDSHKDTIKTHDFERKYTPFDSCHETKNGFRPIRKRKTNLLCNKSCLKDKSPEIENLTTNNYGLPCCQESTIIPFLPAFSGIIISNIILKR